MSLFFVLKPDLSLTANGACSLWAYLHRYWEAKDNEEKAPGLGMERELVTVSINTFKFQKCWWTFPGIKVKKAHHTVINLNAITVNSLFGPRCSEHTSQVHRRILVYTCCYTLKNVLQKGKFYDPPTDRTLTIFSKLYSKEDTPNWSKTLWK